jgi:integrase
MTEQIRKMLDVLPDSSLGCRDGALLLLGFSGGFRRSEIVGLDVADIEFTSDGLVIHQRRSKTDQEGEGRKVGIPFGSTPMTCPVRSLRAWLDAASITQGPVFRGVGRWGHVDDGRLDDRAVARVVQKYAKLIGLDPTKFAGHSLRAGLATSAARAGRSERSIMNQTGHRSVTMVRKYIREGSLFVENAAAGLL